MCDERRVDRRAVRGTTTSLWVACGAALAWCVLALAANPAAAAAATLSVETSGSDGGDCLASPCATIQYAVDQADAGDTIEVGPGTYEETVAVKKEVALRGANAGVPASGARGTETTIAATGAGTKALTVGGPGITVDGFTVTSDAAYALYAEGTTGLRVADSIVRSGQRALTLTLGSEAAAIERNLIEGDLYGLVAAGAGAYRDLRVADNTIVATPAGSYAMFNAGEGTFPGLRVVDNRFRGSSNIGGSVEGGVVSGNSFAVEAGGLGLQIDLHESTVSANSFEGNGVGSCLQLFGSQYELDPSHGATISGNQLHGCAPFAVQLSPDIDDIAVTGNTITDAYDGIDTRLLAGEAPWDLSGHAIRIVGNRIVGSTHLGIENSVEGTLEAADNWWGCNAGPTLGGGNGCDPVSAGVEAAPWLVLRTAAPASIRSGASATVTAAIDTDSGGARVATVPDGTPVAFSTDLGSLDPLAAATAGGGATTALASPTPGIATVAATVDRQTVSAAVGIEAPPRPRPPRRNGAPPPKPPTPKVHLAGDGAPLRVSAGGTVTVASITCPQGSCVIAIKQRKVKIGRRGYPLKLKLHRLVREGRSTSVTAVLPRPARRALGAKGKGRAIVRLRLFSGAGVQELPIRVRVKAP